MARKKVNKKPEREKYDIWKHGISFQFISLFLTCREQCRLKYVEGWRSRDRKLPFEQGSLIGSILNSVYRNHKGVPKLDQIIQMISAYEHEWKKDAKRPIPSELEMLDNAAGMAETILPEYFQYYRDEDWKQIKWKGVERQWNFEVELADGRKLPLFGYYDGIVEYKKKLYVFETKCLSRVNQADIVDLLPYDLQTMLYLYSLSQENEIGGVYYNVIRKPGHRLGKAEKRSDFWRRVTKAVHADPDQYFYRWRNTVRKEDLNKWADTQLHPILTDIAGWWEGKHPHYINPLNLITKYGRSDYFNPIVFGNFSRCYR